MTQDNGAPMNITLTDETAQPAGNTFQLAEGQTEFFFIRVAFDLLYLNGKDLRTPPLGLISGTESYLDVDAVQ